MLDVWTRQRAETASHVSSSQIQGCASCSLCLAPSLLHSPMGGGSCSLSPPHQGKAWNPGLQLSKQIHYLGNMQSAMAVNKNLALVCFEQLALKLLKAHQINQTLQEGQLVCKSRTVFVDREVLSLSARLGFFRNLVQNPFVSSVFITLWAVRQRIHAWHSGWGVFQIFACPVYLQHLGPRAPFL